MEQLEGRVAVITGGGSGIGEGFARICHEAGMRIVVSDIEEDQAVRVANSVRELGGEAIGLRTDVSDADSVGELADRAYEEFGEVNLLLSNAGVMMVAPLLDTPVRQLSLGQRMRADLAAALLHGPKLLFLDEPTIGLDAAAKLAMRDFVRTLNRAEGVTVVLTTHDMDDIEALCERILVIGQGRILIDGDIDDLRRRVGNERVLIVDFEEPGSLPALEHELEGAGLREVRVTGKRARIGFDAGAIAPAALIAQVTSRFEVHDLFLEHPPIEHTVADLYAEHGEGGE